MIRLAESGHHTVAYSLGYWIGSILVYALLVAVYFVPALLAVFRAARAGSQVGGAADVSSAQPMLARARSAT